MNFWIFFIGLSIVSYLVSITFQQKFKKYLSVPSSLGLTGKETAEFFLSAYGIRDVEVILSRGFLSDHYNPLTKTIALSKNVYYGRSIASVAVASHETGHAIQHHQNFFWVKVRSGLVPVVQFGSKLSSWLILGGMFTLHTFPQLMLLGIIAYGLVVLFSFITLPVEFDASARALKWLKENGYVQSREYSMAKDALKWAAMTYVVSALTALATLVYYLLIFLSTRDD